MTATTDHLCSPCETCGICSCGAAHTVRVGFVKVCECGLCPTCRHKLGSPRVTHLVHDCPAERRRVGT